MLTPEQIETRKAGIGGSDAAAVLGLSKYTSPLEVYQEKVGDAEPEDLSDNDAVHFGNVLEDVIADEFSRRTGKKVRRRTETLTHKEHAFMLAHLDRKVEGESALLECKTAGQYMSSEWGPTGSDQIPKPYIVQVQHYLAVTGYETGYLAVLIGGRDFRIYTIPRNERLIEKLIELEGRFWNNHVLKREAPDPRDLKDIQRLWPDDNGKPITADLDTLAAAEWMAKTQEEVKLKEIAVDGFKFQIQNHMKDNADLLVDENDGSIIATFKTNKAGSRVFRLTKKFYASVNKVEEESK